LGIFWNGRVKPEKKDLKRFSRGSARTARYADGLKKTSSETIHEKERTRMRTLAAKRGLADAVWRGSQFLTEVGWREFAHHLLFHFPHTPVEPLRVEFKKFPWRADTAGLRAWQKRRTGFPIVDAGMRELWATGWMHNRVRMIVASFLVKDLLLPWQDGARWFWDTLVDADLANNAANWQWVAGCGADAAPFFRIFNPVLQGEKFDPKGAYVRKFVPELEDVADKYVHHPWDAPEPPANYPSAIVDLAQGRARALTAFRALKG
jgi:deoxyribodipyrimidine photo-lyase